MATFYGTIQGNRGEATRLGSYDSGFRASAQSWNGSVITYLKYAKMEESDEDKLNIEIYLSDDSAESSWNSNCYFDGTLDELKECFNMYSTYKYEQEEMKKEDFAWYDFKNDSIREELQ